MGIYKDIPDSGEKLIDSEEGWKVLKIFATEWMSRRNNGRWG